MLARDDRYFRQQTTTDDYYRSTFDSHRSTQRIDGTGDTHYQGNRSLGGNGWQGHWTERQFAESEVEHGSYYSPLFPEDDRPNSYNVTIDHSAEASVDTPTAYGYSTNPPVNLPPAGSLGPGGFATQEDSQAISDLQGQVAMNGSAAALDYSARDELFAALAAGTEELAVDDSNSAATSQSASTLTRAYVTDSGSSSSVLNGLDPVNLIADPDSRLAIQRGVHFPSQFKLADHMQRLSTRSTEAQTTGGRGDLCIRFPGTCTGASPSSGNSDDGNDVGQSALEDPGFGVRDAASIGVGFIPFVGSGQSVVELISGYDYISGEPTSRWLAAVGIFAGVVPGGKGALKGGSKLIKIAGDGATHADEFVDTAKAVSKAPRGGRHVLDLRLSPSVEASLGETIVGSWTHAPYPGHLGGLLSKFGLNRPMANNVTIRFKDGLDDLTKTWVKSHEAVHYAAAKHPFWRELSFLGDPKIGAGRIPGVHFVAQFIEESRAYGVGSPFAQTFMRPGAALSRLTPSAYVDLGIATVFYPSIIVLGDMLLNDE